MDYKAKEFCDLRLREALDELSQIVFEDSFTAPGQPGYEAQSVQDAHGVAMKDNQKGDQ